MNCSLFLPSFVGYVLDDFPSTSEEYLSIDDQFEFLKKLPLKPDYLINLRVSRRTFHIYGSNV